MSEQMTNTAEMNAADGVSEAQLFFYSSSHGMTASLVERLPFSSYRIKGSYRVKRSEPIIATGPFVLFAPTYKTEHDRNYIPRCLKEFLMTERNHEHMVGVVGVGNISFGSDYNKAADVVSEKFDVPVLGKVELSGTIDDVEQLTVSIADVLMGSDKAASSVDHREH